MTSSLFLELALSLTLQIALIVVLTHCLVQFLATACMKHRTWTVSFMIQLLMIAAAILFPHARLLQRYLPETLPSAEVASLQIRLGQSLFYVWLAGAVFSMLLVAYRLIQVHRFLRTCKPLAPESLEPEAEHLVTNSGLWPSGRSVRLLVSNSTAVPFCWQFHRPCIVLPQYLLGIPASQLRYILRHELEHLKSGHPLQLFLQRVVETVFWFHPVVWWGSRQAAILREFSCDDAAIEEYAQGRQPDVAGYLAAMLIVVEMGLEFENGVSTTLTFGRKQSIVAARAERLVKVAQYRGKTARHISPVLAWSVLVAAMIIVQAFWLPVDVLASRRSELSPWPRWTATVLHDFGIQVRDFEVFDQRCEVYELREAERSPSVPRVGKALAN